MYGLVLMMAMTGGAQGPGICVVNGYAGGWGWGTPPGMGYGYLVTPVHTCCGVVLPPMPAGGETISQDEAQAWDTYINSLEGDEKADMMCVWFKADTCARRKLVSKLVALRQQVKEEQEKEEGGAPLTEEEEKKWQSYLDKLKGDRKKEMEEKWKKADNKGKRQLLEEIDDEEVRARPARRRNLARR
jgi:hypothetical protein